MGPPGVKTTVLLQEIRRTDFKPMRLSSPAGRHRICSIRVPHLGGAYPMPMHSRLPEELPDELPRELVDLARSIAALPANFQPELETAYVRVVDAVRRRRRILALVQEALSQVRLDIKYLMFDLDMTRKERDELRERLGG
jgi:hypothetical protein